MTLSSGKQHSTLRDAVEGARVSNQEHLSWCRVQLGYLKARRDVELIRSAKVYVDEAAAPAPGAIANHEPRHDPPLFLPESVLAHRLLDGLQGLEIGGAAHNAFGLNTKNVGISADMESVDFEVYKAHQIAFCGTWLPIDIPGYANAIPVEASSSDFVIHSHVWEHLPNPLRALEEWVRVTRHDGYVYAIVPKRDAAEGDAQRSVTPIQTQILHYLLNTSAEERAVIDNVPVRGHYTVFDQDALLDIESWFNAFHLDAQLRRAAYQETDDKGGNGHAIVWQVSKLAPAQ
jgi:SAM-dependent methyltransferase